MPVRRVTIGDIARASDASPTTVSLVLRDKPGIGDETRERVLAAAHALGYRRRSARPVREERDLRSIALLFRARTRSPEDEAPRVNPFYSWVLTGLEAAARAQRMNLLYATLPVDDDNMVTDVPSHILDQRLDGALIVGPFSDRTLSEMLGARSLPVVLVDGPAVPRAFDVVASDNVEGARIAVQHLIASGHRDIGLIAPAQSSDPNFLQRADGYRRAMADAGLSPLHGEIDERNVGRVVGELLTAHPEVTALFAVNDRFAVDAMRAAIATGRRVPETLSIVGFDDTDHASQALPGLTTMAVDKVNMGRRAVDLLDFRIRWPEAAATLTTLAPRLVVRQSVARGPAADGLDASDRPISTYPATD